MWWHSIELGIALQKISDISVINLMNKKERNLLIDTCTQHPPAQCFRCLTRECCNVGQWVQSVSLYIDTKCKRWVVYFYCIDTLHGSKCSLEIRTLTFTRSMVLINIDVKEYLSTKLSTNKQTWVFTTFFFPTNKINIIVWRHHQALPALFVQSPGRWAPI